MAGEAIRSFADPETEFELVRSDTPFAHDGLKPNEPTGAVRCLECGQVAGCVDYIPHKPDCSQSNVHSRWWAESHGCGHQH